MACYSNTTCSERDGLISPSSEETGLTIKIAQPNWHIISRLMPALNVLVESSINIGGSTYLKEGSLKSPFCQSTRKLFIIYRCVKV